MFQQILTPWRWEALFEAWPLFAKAFLVTLEVAVLGLLLSMLLGIVFGVLSTTRSPVFRAISRVYVEVFQNTPLLLQAFVFYFALSIAGIKLGMATIGILSVGLYHGAYISEVVRTGIQSIPVGQSEAAQSQGFTYLQTMRHIVLPQTVKIVLPPLVNQLVNLIKNTSVLALIGGGELMNRVNDWANNGTMSYGPAYMVCALLYFALCFPLATWARRYEEKLKSHDVQENDGKSKNDNNEEVPA